jgi:hypothetical protein
MMKHKVWKQGSEVVPGTKLMSFTNEEWEFVGCYHPRKLTMKQGTWQQELYPQVFGVIIEDIEEDKHESK